MTKAEQAALAEMDTTPERIAERQEHISQLLNGSDKLGEQLKASVALMEDVEAHKITPIFSRFGKCPVCNEPAIFQDRNRLANCGHVRRSHGKLVPREEQKSPTIAQQPGFLSAEQVLRLRDLIDTRETRRIELETAKDHLANREGALDAADNELDEFLLELQAKKTG